MKLKLDLKMYLKNNWWKYLIITCVIAVDLVTKALIVTETSLGTETSLIGNIVVILPTKNSGAGFSMLSGKRWFLIVTTFIFLIALAVFDLLYQKKSALFCTATGLVIGGAIGNLVDRLLFGYVRDFIYLKFINFAVFNVADMALTVGIILLLVYIIFYSSKNEPKVEMQSQNKSDFKNKDITSNIDTKSQQNSKTSDNTAKNALEDSNAKDNSN
jgi:signal peptidase II